ncbi:MAG: Coenzyme F420 hydrogenase/dehydrogenase, beta subunit C-terminal domain [Bacteroidales bacterium]|nr:Coenzyme F420 hydrogenase/dehydrogenase, beta subunit C-terminal domain [Bacteroidales bacterium]
MNKVICDNDICTGCGVCYNVCPVKCITMEYDEEGFLFPIVNEERCIKCNKCKEGCPSLNELTNKNYEKPIAIGCWNKNQNIIEKSSSGGAFAAIAEEILKENGVVVGCVMDEDLNVYHTIANNEKELEMMHGSKYLQSETRSVYVDIKGLLDGGKKVLFTGCPCQVAGLYNYLDGESYNNLITVDLICHGVGSKKFFDMYIYEMNKKYKEKVTKISFRSKKNGWRKYTTKISFITRSDIYISAIKDLYMSCYLQRAIYRKSCYQCKYSRLPRIADITIGDFIGIDRKQIDKKSYQKGVSVVLLNNKKAESYFENIKTKLNWVARPLQEAVLSNDNINKTSIMPECRKNILKDNGSAKQLRDKYCKYKFRVHVANFFGEDIVIFLKKVVRWLKT